MSQPSILHFFCGKAGAGKSSLAMALAQETAAILISEDIWLSRLYGDQIMVFADYIRFSTKLKTVVAPLVVDLLKNGNSVVMDFQANTKTRRAWLRSIFEEADAAHYLHFVDTPNQICLERIAKRNLERPEGSSQLTEEDFNHVSSFFEAPDESERFMVKTYRV
jgi:predicted kinase